MLTDQLTAQDIRQTIIAFMRLPEAEFMVAALVIADLKQQALAKAERKARVAEIRARAKALAVELRGLSRAELGRQFMETLDAIRAEAIANGTALDIDEATWQSE